VSGAEAKKLADAGAPVVDVRTPGEFKQGHVPGAINIPFEQVIGNAAKIGDPAKPVVLYCRSGRRSGIAARTLVDLGFTQIADMQAISSWPGEPQRGGTVPRADAGGSMTAVAAGQAALAPFKSALREALSQGLSKGGPERAVEVCAHIAPELLEAGQRPGVKVGRTSDRLRNPVNAAPAWVSPLLESYGAAKGGEPRVVAVDLERLGYVEPIMVQPMCLACHGKAVAPNVAATLKSRYPGDRAIGYEAGDFRGLMWVELDRKVVTP